MGKRHYIIPIFVPHEGCPHDCAFCNQARITGEETNEITGPKFKLENAVNAKFVKDTIDEYIETIVREENTTVEVSFFGGTFTAIDLTKQKRLLSVAKEYKEKGIIDYIRLSTRPDYIDDDILTHLKSFSVDIIELGVQSLDEEVLLKSTRGHTSGDVEIASKLIKDYGFTLGHQIMLGLPSDTKEKDIETTKKSISLNPDIARIYPALTIKDTAMEYMYKNNTYVPYTLDECVDIAKACYKLYIEARVNIIRVGLQATDNIAEGEDIVTGPFHPAFRELVEADILNEEILKLIKANKITSEIVIEISNRSISKLYADKKRYFIDFKNKVDNNILVNVIKDMDKSFINIKTNNKVYKIDII
ncbi:radical SAM protein [uncultured Clostridium sp.]|uniref:elongator complex protein 3 n=1 Tax=uncultured Clostridium sp. TaxID=59620 RepID=UPI00262311AF|nr:radical SAM protein [uncultured Clostridium sp.]